MLVCSSMSKHMKRVIVNCKRKGRTQSIKTDTGPTMPLLFGSSSINTPPKAATSTASYTSVWNVTCLGFRTGPSSLLRPARAEEVPRLGTLATSSREVRAVSWTPKRPRHQLSKGAASGLESRPWHQLSRGAASGPESRPRHQLNKGAPSGSESPSSSVLPPSPAQPRLVQESVASWSSGSSSRRSAFSRCARPAPAAGGRSIGNSSASERPDGRGIGRLRLRTRAPALRRALSGFF
mmetsp:Transcript_24009/g.75506  ORF Transcript_24009/g.75506 Transcript_24009/m.75506 type:complete len:237 (-) Transcript_24009:13-723(-)